MPFASSRSIQSPARYRRRRVPRQRGFNENFVDWRTDLTDPDDRQASTMPSRKEIDLMKVNPVSDQSQPLGWCAGKSRRARQGHQCGHDVPSTGIDSTDAGQVQPANKPNDAKVQPPLCDCATWFTVRGADGTFNEHHVPERGLAAKSPGSNTGGSARTRRTCCTTRVTTFASATTRTDREARQRPPPRQRTPGRSSVLEGLPG